MVEKFFDLPGWIQLLFGGLVMIAIAVCLGFFSLRGIKTPLPPNTVDISGRR